MSAVASRPAGSARLIAAVQTCRRKVDGLADDATWRAFLTRVAGADSLRAMDGRQLGRVLDALHQAGAPRLPGAASGARLRHDGAAAPGGKPALDDRPQVRMARGLWIELHQAGAVRDASEAALEAFAKRVTGKARLAWCRPFDLNKLIEALKDWRDRTDANDPVVRAAAAMTIEPGETRDQALVTALWRALCDAGAMRTGTHARLDTWLARNFGVANTAALDAEAAERAVRLLGAWLRKAMRERASGATRAASARDGAA
jgi:hypothetical protein